ncbi:unnamed protein product [Clavelina lepadiformis]|uniref:P-type domain-containing protein n=1 Tax=Clavelina lepadiformis TaxID=159417 RepID=A0ABP0G9M9_CLALP
MDCFKFIVGILVAFIHVLLVQSEQQCTSCFECADQIRCGHNSVSRAGCEEQGCMWCPKTAGNIQQCFYPWKQTNKTDCMVEENKRVGCGSNCVTETNCKEEHCCWEESTGENIPSCFFSNRMKSAPSPECSGCDRCSLRVDCGYSGVNEAGCLEKGCLWCPTDMEDEPWCLYPWEENLSKEKKCNIEEDMRLYCGLFGIDEETCSSKGCCWDEVNSPYDIPWCYHSDKVKITPQCLNCDQCFQKFRCGRPGINKTECEKMSCLWCPEEGGNDPWCIYSLHPGTSIGAENTCLIQVKKNTVTHKLDHQKEMFEDQTCSIEMQSELNY